MKKVRLATREQRLFEAITKQVNADKVEQAKDNSILSKVMNTTEKTEPVKAAKKGRKLTVKAKPEISRMQQKRQELRLKALQNNKLRSVEPGEKQANDNNVNDTSFYSIESQKLGKINDAKKADKLLEELGLTVINLDKDAFNDTGISDLYEYHDKDERLTKMLSQISEE